MKNIVVQIGSLLFEKEHAARGIGTYTRLLISSLEKIRDLTVLKASAETEKSITPDIIHYPSFDFFFPTLPFNIKKKVVVTIHDVIPLIYPDKYPSGIKGKLNFKKQLLALRTVDAVITDSQRSKLDIIRFLKVPSTKITVIPLAAHPEFNTQSKSKIERYKKMYNLPDTYVLYVGDIGYNKNIPQLIKMLKYLPENIHLVCVGKNFRPQDIPEWNWIETQIAMSDVDKRVCFLNTVRIDSLEDLSAIYSGALAYIQPSLYEGFGLPLLEAMQCRTPVIASNTPALLEVGSHYALYAEPEAEELANQVLEIQNWTKRSRQEFIEKAYTWSQSFSWDKTAQATATVYRSICQ